jgi:hypothetical protein
MKFSMDMTRTEQQEATGQTSTWLTSNFQVLDGTVDLPHTSVLILPIWSHYVLHVLQPAYFQHRL